MTGSMDKAHIDEMYKLSLIESAVDFTYSALSSEIEEAESHLALVLSALSVIDVSEIESRVEHIQSDVDALKIDVSILESLAESKLDNIALMVSALSAIDISEIESRVTHMQSDVEAVKSEVRHTKSDVEATKSEVRHVKGQQDTGYTKSVASSEALRVVDSIVDDIQSHIHAAGFDVSAIESKLDGQISSHLINIHGDTLLIPDVQSDVHAAGSRIADVKSDVEAVKSEVRHVKGQQDTGYTKSVAASEALRTVDSLVDDIQSHVHTESSRIQHVKSDVDALKLDVSAVESKLDLQYPLTEYAREIGELFIIADQDPFDSAVAVAGNAERWNAGYTSGAEGGSADINTTTAGKLMVQVDPDATPTASEYAVNKRLPLTSRYFVVVVDFNATFGADTAGWKHVNMQIMKGIAVDLNNRVSIQKQAQTGASQRFIASAWFNGVAESQPLFASTDNVAAFKIERLDNIWRIYYSLTQHPNYVWVLLAQYEDVNNRMTSRCTVYLGAYSPGEADAATARGDFDNFRYFISVGGIEIQNSIVESLIEGPALSHLLNIHADTLLIPDVQSDVHAAGSRIQHVKSDLEDVKSRVLDIQSHAHAIHTDVDQVESYLTDVQSHVHTMNSRVQTVDSRVQHIKSDVEDIKGHTDTFATYITKSVASSEALRVVDSVLDAIFDLQRAGGTLKLSSIEQNIYINDAPSGNFIVDAVLIDLTNLAAGDTVKVRTSYRIKSGGSYRLEDSDVYAGVQPYPLIRVDGQPNRYGAKVTAQQTATAVAGSYPTADYEYWTYA